MRRFEPLNQTPPQNWAERLIPIGKVTHISLRRGVAMEIVSTQLHEFPANCQIALEFFHCSNVVKLRAMVEDWPLDRIITELDLARGPSPTH